MARKRKTQKPSGPGPPRKEETRVHDIPGQVSIERSPFRLRGRVSYLSTDIDGLYGYVKQQKSVKLSAAARKFGVSRELIEGWGGILEDHRMIEMHYPVTGEPLLRIPAAGKDKAKKPQKPGKKSRKRPRPRHLRFTKKRLLIMAEIVVLGNLLIYIFLVNQHLRSNFIPTLIYQIANLPFSIANLPDYIMGLLTQLSGRGMPINPLYFMIGMIIVIFWIAAVFMQKRKEKAYVRDWRKRHRKA
jgi:hypothetical protein